MNPLYELVPISERPEDVKRFFALHEVPSAQYLIDNNVTHYLQPIDPETLKARIREELGKAWDGGQQKMLASENYDRDLIGVKAYEEIPNRETYINSVIDNYFKQ